MTGVSHQALIGAAAPPLSFAFFDDAADTSGTTLTMPAGIAANDLGVIVEWTSGTDPVTPTGWTSAFQQALFGTLWLSVSYKKLLGTETTITCGDNVAPARTVHVFRPNKAYATITAGSWTANYGGSSAPSNRTVSASGQPAPLIVFGIKGGTDGALQLTGSPAFTADISAIAGTHGIRTGYLIYNPGSSPADNTVSGGDDGEGNMLTAGYLRMTA